MTQHFRSPFRRGPQAALAVIAAGLLAAIMIALSPANTRGPDATPEATPAAHQLHRLYFGRSMPCGGGVTDALWQAFVAEEVTPRFPDGLTVWRADGQWRNHQGSVEREPTFVLELLHTPDAAKDSAVAEIIREYKQRFCQHSVLWLRDRVQVHG